LEGFELAVVMMNSFHGFSCNVGRMIILRSYSNIGIYEISNMHYLKEMIAFRLHLQFVLDFFLICNAIVDGELY
jgi:hypothetical protein